MTTRKGRPLAETYRADQTAFAFARLRYLARLVVAGDTEAMTVARSLSGDDSPDAGVMLSIERGDVVARGGWLTRFWVETLGESFVRSGTENYVTASFKVGGSRELFSVTIQREGKLTPHEARMRAEDQRDKAMARVAVLEEKLALLKAKGKR